MYNAIELSTNNWKNEAIN